MANITGTVSVRTPVTPQTTIADLTRAFERGGENQHVRFSDAKGLHTHSKFGSSNMDFLAAFRNRGALNERQAMRQEGARVVEKALDDQFGQGMGKYVFGQLGLDKTEGVTLRELRQIERFSETLLSNTVSEMVDRTGGGIDGYAVLRGINRDLGLVKDDAEHAYEFYDLKGGETDRVLGQMAAAIKSLPEGLSQAEYKRVAVGEVVKYNLLKLNRESGQPLSENQLEDFNLVMNALFQPNSDIKQYEPEAIFNAMREHVTKGNMPNPQVFMNTLEMTA